MEIGMDKRQSDIFMRKFDELIKKKAKVAPCFFFCVAVIQFIFKSKNYNNQSCNKL